MSKKISRTVGTESTADTTKIKIDATAMAGFVAIVKNWKKGVAPLKIKAIGQEWTELMKDKYYYSLVEMLCEAISLDFDEVLNWLEGEESSFDPDNLTINLQIS